MSKHTPTGRPRGWNLRGSESNRCHRRYAKRGDGEAPTPLAAIRSSRQKAYIAVADAVSTAMRGVGHNQLSRRVGRDMGRTLAQIYRENDTSVSTLADIAAATGCELVVELRPLASRAGARPYLTVVKTDMVA